MSSKNMTYYTVPSIIMVAVLISFMDKIQKVKVNIT